MQFKAPIITHRSPTLRPQHFAASNNDTIPVAAPPPGCMVSIMPSCPPVDDEGWSVRTTLLLPRVSLSPETEEERRRIQALIAAGIVTSLATSDADEPGTSLARALSPTRTSGWTRALAVVEPGLAPWDDAS